MSYFVKYIEQWIVEFYFTNCGFFILKCFNNCNVIITLWKKKQIHEYCRKNMYAYHCYFTGKRSINHVPLPCGKLLHLTDDTPNVIVTSPSYPRNYPPLSTCHTFVTAPFGKQIYIDFLHFDIEDAKQYILFLFYFFFPPNKRLHKCMMQYKGDLKWHYAH
jgi:hypothetical protein